MAAIKVSILYPAGAGKRFDHSYYTTIHMPMAGRLLEPTRYEIDRGLGGATPGSEAPYVGGCHFYFSTLGDFQRAITAHVAELQADIPNYTDIAPVIQVSEVTSS